MKRRIMCLALSLMLVLSSLGVFVYAKDEAELSATTWTQKVLSAKDDNYANEKKNYSSSEKLWDSETEYRYDRYISFVGSNDEGNIEYGGGSPYFYIGNWSIGTIPSAELGGKFYVAMLVRTNSASSPVYNPLNITGSGSKQTASPAPFKGDGSWEFNYIDFELPTTVTSFTHGHLKFTTANGKYLDLAAWGLFASTVSKADAEATLKNASKVPASSLKATTFMNADGSVLSENLLGTVTAPTLADTEESAFAGWTTEKGSNTVTVKGGASYTPTGKDVLYPVYIRRVRFVNGTVSASGDGLTAETAYKTFAEASSALNASGGTIVVCGETADFSLANTGDIVITSVYGGVDYRENGAKLNFPSAYNKIILGYLENPGKVTFENLTVVNPSSDGWHLMGHDVVIKDSVKQLNSSGGNAKIQLMAVCSSNATPPASITRRFSVTVDNQYNTSVILGPRVPETLAGVDITVNGILDGVAISNNTYEKYDWLDTSPKFGQLTVNGDVRITVNGKLSSIYARKHVLTADSFDYGLAKIKGNLGVIVNHGGAMTGNIDSIVTSRTEGKWYKLVGIEGAHLAYGESGDKVVLTLDESLDYNFVTISNGNSKTYPFLIEDGEAVITIPESGNYTMTLSKNESKTVTLVDRKGGSMVEPINAFGGFDITLPTLSDTDILYFEGWTDEENGNTAKYQGGASFTVNENITLYAVWTEAETYKVTFKNGDAEFASFVGVKGATIIYPDTYPIKDGYYFTGWDENPEKLGEEDITLNATFKTASEVGAIYYWNGESASDGDGTYAKPYKLLATLVKKLNETGGTVVVTGRCDIIYQPTLKSVYDVTFTALDPLTGHDFGGEFDSTVTYNGGHLYMPQGVYWGGATYKTGAIIFENIDILNVNGQYGIGHLTFDGHEFVIGENVRHLSPETGNEITWFVGGTSSNNAAKPHEVKAVIKSIFEGHNWLARGGGTYEIDNVDYTYYAKAVTNIAHDSADVVTLTGALRFTFFAGSEGSKLYHSRASYAFGDKAYASIILNDDVTIINQLKTDSDGLDGRVYTVKASEGVRVTHADKKGVYTVESDEFNYAELLDADGKTVDKSIIGDGTTLTASGYGEYTVRASNKTLYGIDYVTSPYDETCPDSFRVTSEETDKHKVILPILATQSAHSFDGWTTTENGTVADYDGGEEITLSAVLTLYAVWKEIPTYTVTFKDDNGNVLYQHTGYEGAPMKFPENNPYKYGKKLLGYAYEGTSEIITADATFTAENRTALPVWGDIPAGETRIYVNGNSGNDSNEGISPDTALKTIESAVTRLKTSGGYIIVTGGSNTLSRNWNNGGDITLTSLDPVSGIDYRAKISDDGKSFTDGAYITYAYTPFGSTVITGKITINNVVFLNTTNNEFLCFHGHPFEIGKGVYSYQQKTAGDSITTTNLNIRALGEADSTKTNPEGIVFTVNDLEAGMLRVFAIGKASNTIPGIDITVDSDFSGNITVANDSLGGVSTVDGDIKITINGKMKNSFGFNGMTNPVKGNIYVACAYGTTAIVSNIRQEEGYGAYIVTAGEGVKLAHGENGSYTAESADGKEYSYATVTDGDEAILDVIAVTDGKASFTPESYGEYTVEFTNTAMRSLTLVTGMDEDSTAWYENGTEVEIPTDIYRYGYIFGGWTDGTDTYTEGTITMPDKNITLTAIWTEAPKYTITFDANGNDITVPEAIEEYNGENIILEKLTLGSATFIGWSENPDAVTGKLNHTAEKDTTLYAIATSGPAYIVDTYYRGDPENYTGTRNSFRRYVIDVYLENAVASSGSFKLNTDNKFLYYLGNVPQDGISSTVDAPVVSGNSGTPGLQYFTTPYIEYKWTSEAPVNATNGRIRVARIMMYFSSWGMGYNQIEMRTTDEIVSPFEGYTALADEESAYVSASFYKGVKSDEVKISGKVTLEGRERGTAAAYDFVKLYILDEAGDAVDFKVLENMQSDRRTFSFTSDIIPGNYTVKVMKNGYLTRLVPLTVTDGGEIPEIVMYAGDTLDASGVGDGIVDIDDFTRVLKGFSKDFPLSEYINAIDLNEDGVINVSDLAIVKSGVRATVSGIKLEAVVDRENYKVDDWSISVSGSTVTVTGGSEKALANATSFIENEYAKDGKYRLPSRTNHTRDYDLASITVGGVSIGNYRIVTAENDEIASEYAQYIYDYIAEISGYGLEIVTDAEEKTDYEILVGATNRRESPITEIEKYKVYEEDGKFYVFYGDEQSAEMACLDLCEKILGKSSEGFDGAASVEVKSGASFEGEWSVLARFGVMSDSHIGERYNWANYDWLHNTFDNFERIHEENPLDFIVSLGDNIDDGYANTYAADYAVYLEEMKNLDICDPVNPIEGREEGKIPHYEICGNHDPIAGQLDANGDLKIRFIKNGLWYTENEKGEKVAHIAFFTNYGGYPLHDYAYSGTYASYFSYGKVDDAMVKFVEDSIIEANAEGAKHIILYNHWGMSQQVGSPMLPETGLGKIASVCEKYDIKLYFNGHEHDVPYSLRRYNEIYDYDVSMTSQKHAVVEITSLRAKVTIYYSASNKIYREDIVPLSGRGEAKQKLAE